MSSNLKIRYNFSRKKKPFKAERKAQRKERVSKFAGGEKLSVLRRRLKEALPKKGWRGGQERRAEGPHFLQRNLHIFLLRPSANGNHKKFLIEECPVLI